MFVIAIVLQVVPPLSDELKEVWVLGWLMEGG